jgi:hypothetical protein
LEESAYASRLAAMAEGRLVETSVDQVMAASAGWSAWVQAVPEDRTQVRARLAGVQHEPRVYLRPEGLAVLAEDEKDGRSLLAATVGDDYSRATMDKSAVTFEDAFILMERRDLGARGPAS